MRYRAIVAYDGGPFRGWQLQGHGGTIQGELERALAVVLREPIRVHAAGRTDSGVHARGQVIAFELARSLVEAELGRVVRSINGVLPPQIAIRSLECVPAEFDPRRDAVARAYSYRIWNHPVRCPLELGRSWHVREPLDATAMAAAAAAVVGHHDFTSFQGADRVPRLSLRTVTRSSVERRDAVIGYEIESKAFARHMVRNLVGALVAIGRGDLPIAAMMELLLARDRRLAPEPAPAAGLVLEWVKYER